MLNLTLNPRPQTEHLTLYLLASSADNFCKQFGPRSGPTKCRALSGSKLFDTLMVFLKEFFKKVDFEKYQQTKKKMKNFPGDKELNFTLNPLDWSTMPIGFYVHSFLTNSCFL